MGEADDNAEGGESYGVGVKTENRVVGGGERGGGIQGNWKLKVGLGCVLCFLVGGKK